MPPLSQILADSPPSSACYSQTAHMSSQAALPCPCTALGCSSPASVHGCMMPARNACCVTCSHTLVDAVGPKHTEEGTCSGMLHLLSEKCCTVQMGSNRVNLGSVGLVSHPAHVTSGNSWWDLFAPTTLGFEDQGVTTVSAGNTSAIRGQPATCQMLRVFPGMGLGSTHTLADCCFNSSTATLSLQNMGTFRPLPSTCQATCSPTLLPVQCGWLQFCDLPWSGSPDCPRLPDHYSRDCSLANGTPSVTLICPSNCLEEGTGNQMLQGKSGGDLAKGQNWPFDPRPLGHEDPLHTAASQRVYPLEYLLLCYTSTFTTCVTHESQLVSFTTRDCVPYMQCTHMRRAVYKAPLAWRGIDNPKLLQYVGVHQLALVPLRRLVT